MPLKRRWSFKGFSALFESLLSSFFLLLFVLFAGGCISGACFTCRTATPHSDIVSLGSQFRLQEWDDGSLGDLHVFQLWHLPQSTVLLVVLIPLQWNFDGCQITKSRRVCAGSLQTSQEDLGAWALKSEMVATSLSQVVYTGSLQASPSCLDVGSFAAPEGGLLANVFNHEPEGFTPDRNKRSRVTDTAIQSPAQDLRRLSRSSRAAVART